jgi:DNA polymerase
MAGTDDDAALLSFYLDSGADEAIAETPQNQLAPKQPRPEPQPETTPKPAPGRSLAEAPAAPAINRLALGDPNAAVATAQEQAEQCQTLEDLRQALAAFEGCALRDTATNLVFADGNPESGLMFVGEGPGAEEDRQGLPFVGPSGKLLDRMLAAIGRDRTSAYITNIVPWRPPGNRNPSSDETTACLPFTSRHIALAKPKVLVLLGTTAAATILGSTQGITRLRGRWHNYDAGGTVIDVMPTYHPAYLLRQPAQKQQAWQDFLAIKLRLEAK